MTVLARLLAATTFAGMKYLKGLFSVEEVTGRVHARSG